MAIDPTDEALFFENPKLYRSPPGEFGILYLLRRDIDQCIAGSILWPGAMAIMAGIDLLAKFAAGDDAVGQVGNRFRDFLGQYFHLCKSAAAVFQTISFTTDINGCGVVQ